MFSTHASLVVAAVPPAGGVYVQPIKILVVIVLLLGWAAVIQWIDRDTDRVKTKREQWNMVVMFGGLVGFLLLLAPPWAGPLYFAGLGAWLVLAGGSCLAYVIHRNGRVVPAARVLTADHFKRMFSGGEKKHTVKDRGQRVQLLDSTGKQVPLPEDQEEGEAFFAVQDFLFDLLWRRVTDVDVLASQDRYRLVYKIDGVASERADGLSPIEGERIFRFLKRIAGLNAEEIRRPQTGKIQVALLGGTGAPGLTEVHTSGTTAGERLRLKMPSSATLMRVQELGIAEPRMDLVKSLISAPRGLVLFSGPSQTGVTTSQYAFLRSHDAFMQNIYTLERRPLLPLDNITQHTYDGANHDVNYARQLQSVLRREPDIVMVGECDDRETAQIASRSAAEDRKVYMAIAAKDCFDALSRYLGLVEDMRLASEALIGIVSQRLVRILCPECREAFKPDAAMLKKLNLPADKIERFYRPPSQPILDKKGHEIICPKCQGTGYFGRTGLFEVMTVDAAIKKLIAEGAPVARIKSECRKNKMYYLQEEGLLKVIEGTTSLNEVLRVLKDQQQK